MAEYLPPRAQKNVYQYLPLAVSPPSFTDMRPSSVLYVTRQERLEIR